MAYQQQTPDFVIEKAKEEITQAEKRVEQAKKRIPEHYHDFLTLLDQNVKLFSKDMVGNDQKARDLRLWNEGTYITVSLPYVSVDGRVKMARDEHKKEGKRFEFHPPNVFEVGSLICLQVTVESEIYGPVTGTVQVNIGGKGVDRTNPIENAETSAVGRALSFLGYGLVGTGIASADEVENALEAQKDQSVSSGLSLTNKNVVDFQKKESQPTSRESGDIRPNAQFVALKAKATRGGESLL